jgi:hypothetical protein
MKITVCGAGNAAQLLVPLLANQGEHFITLYAPWAGEAARWRAVLGADGQVMLSRPDGSRLGGRPLLITDDPVAAAAAELVLLAVPAFAHEPVLRALASRLPPGAWIGALPARGGLDWLAESLQVSGEQVIFGLQTLPWACRIRRWGTEVDLLGTKTAVDLATWPGDMAPQVAATMTGLLQVPMRPVSNFLALTLANMGQLIHPGIMYGLFSDWDGAPLGEDQVPLFYGGVDRSTAQILEAMSDEIQAIRQALEQEVPHLDLASVLPLIDWLRQAYVGQIADSSSLQSSFNTNRAYVGLRAPVQLVEENAYRPWFESRYLTEDIPYSLLVSRGIAEIAGVSTPIIDQVILWAQEQMAKSYLVDGHLVGPDVIESRAPQRFGIATVEDLLAWM